MGGLLILVGLGGFLFGIVNLVRPLGFLKLDTRWKAGITTVASLIGVFIGASLLASGPPLTTISATGTTVAIETTTGPEPPSTTTTETAPPDTTTTSVKTTSSTTRPSSTTVMSAATTTPVVIPPGLPSGSEAVVVTTVLDGDTIDVEFPDGSIDRVRLIGINSHEGGECYSEEATEALTDLVTGVEVGMTTDVSDRDIYDRLLRYLWLADGRFVNLELVSGGFALAREYPPDTAHARQLATAQGQASETGAGLWASNACGPDAGTNITVVHIEADAPGNDNNALNGEYVVIRNGNALGAEMTGWVLKDESASHRFEFPAGFTLSPGAEVTVFTGCGVDATVALYWCSNGAVWNNDGDTAFVLDHSGNIVHSLAYTP